MSSSDVATAVAAGPRAAERLLGHEAAENILLRAWGSGRLPHAWLITGPRGIGKATLAYRFARFVLSGAGQGDASGLFGANDAPADTLAVAPDHPVFRRVAGGAHPDLMTLERQDDDKGRRRNVITVDQVRKATDFLHKTPAEGGWRVLIVDPVDDLKFPEGPNALLKILEEPPRKALIVLVSHNPGVLLPTIHSRCCRLALSQLSPSDLSTIFRQVRPEPEVLEGDLELLARLSEGSVGRATALDEAGGVDLYRQISGFMVALPDLDIPALEALADRLSKSGEEMAFRAATTLIAAWVARMIRVHAAQEVPEEISEGEGAAMRRLMDSGGLDRWLALWEKIVRLFDRVERANLDRRQVVVTVFLEMQALARQSTAAAGRR